MRLDKIVFNKIKDSKPQKAARPLSLLPNNDQKKELATICTQLIQKYHDKFNPFQWIQKNIRLNPQTHLHVLRQLNNQSIKNPWGFVNKISLIIDQNLNEADFQKECEIIKSEFADTANKFFGGKP